MSTKLIISAIVIMAVFGVFFIRFRAMQERDHGRVIIDGHTFMIDIARNAIEKTQGLAGRASMATDEGMIFLFKSPANLSFWMKGMRFPLDIIWISQGKIVGITENVPIDTNLVPKLYTPPEPVETVLEINAGEVKKRSIRVGDSVELLLK